MNKRNLPISLSIAMTMRAIEYAFRKSVHELSIDLPSESFGILMITYYQNDIIQQDIAEMVKKDKSAVLRQIDILEKKGLVQRMVDAHDRRKKFVVITERGKNFANEVISKEKDLFETLSQGVEAHEMEAFIKVLSLLKINADNS
jgi:DNA-binding MarR family transcriptional regulator